MNTIAETLIVKLDITMKYQIVGLAILFVFTGISSTLLARLTNSMTSESNDGKLKLFKHPFLQAWGMFLGELGCMVVFLLDRWRRISKRDSKIAQGLTPPKDEVLDAIKFGPWLFCPPAILDLLSTCTSYVGLTLTFPSSYQMLRGFAIIFTALLSQFLLKKPIKLIRWLGIVILLTGLASVGVTDLIKADQAKANLLPGPNDRSFNDVLLGDCLIIVAQLLVALQSVYEEKFAKKYNVPILQAVGLEGIFGFSAMSLLLVPMYFIRNGDGERLEDSLEGFYQLGHNALLLVTFLGTFISIAFNYYSGMSISKKDSSTTKSILSSVRTLAMWGISLSCGWQSFQVLHLVGYILYVFGICIYLEIIVFPCTRSGAYDTNTADMGCCKMNCGNCCSSITCLWCPINIGQTDMENLAARLTSYLGNDTNTALSSPAPTAKPSLKISQPKSKTLPIEPRNIPV